MSRVRAQAQINFLYPQKIGCNRLLHEKYREIPFQGYPKMNSERNELLHRFSPEPPCFRGQ